MVMNRRSFHKGLGWFVLGVALAGSPSRGADPPPATPAANPAEKPVEVPVIIPATLMPANAPEPLRAAVSKLLAADPFERVEGVKALAAMPDQAATVIPILIRVFADNSRSGNMDQDPYMRHTTVANVSGLASAAVANMGQAAIEPLTLALRDPNARLRAVAVQTLGKIPSPQVLPALIDAMRDDVWDVEQAATAALSQRKDPERVDLLLTAAKDKSDRVRCHAVQLLGQIPDPKLVDPMIEALKDTSAETRRAAAMALARLKEKRGAPPLVPLLADDNMPVRIAAMEGLIFLSDPSTVDPLLAVVKEKKDIDVAANAARVLGRLKDPKAVEPLINLLSAEEPRARLAAADALGRLGDARAAEPLANAMLDENWEVQRAAGTALAGIKDPKAIAPLIAVLKKGPPRAKSYAAQLLAAHKGTEVVEALREAMNDPDIGVRAQARQSLERVEKAMR